jgi:hypothetical protein
MGSSNSKARKESKNQAKNTTTPATTTTAPKSNTMSASSAQVPKPNEVPNTGADASRAAKDSTKTANYFELIEVSHSLFSLIYMLIDRTDEHTMVSLTSLPSPTSRSPLSSAELSSTLLLHSTCNRTELSLLLARNTERSGI